ncbi:hypothetical protein KIN20_008393 [Parelaphostrongylus tenuis]|uniref:Uncharacterized protein n=1 Tax=Parelaphostrongylus tenuis TaxID=148309 RepID=A0AAD5MNU9_PARTN|nr:hypothetical protein KIN20_008393 [Parelaphostrongylus tenuis]
MGSGYLLLISTTFEQMKRIRKKESVEAYHDATTRCALNGDCKMPQTKIIFFGDCHKWLHNICILGHKEAPGDEYFFCGYEKKKKAKGQ